MANYNIIQNMFFMDFSQTSLGLLTDHSPRLLMNSSQTAHRPLMDPSQTAHGPLPDFSWTPHRLLMDLCQTSHGPLPDCSRTPPRLLTGPSWIAQTSSGSVLYSTLIGWFLITPFQMLNFYQ